VDVGPRRGVWEWGVEKMHLKTSKRGDKTSKLQKINKLMCIFMYQLQYLEVEVKHTA